MSRNIIIISNHWCHCHFDWLQSGFFVALYQHHLNRPHYHLIMLSGSNHDSSLKYAHVITRLHCFSTRFYALTQYPSFCFDCRFLRTTRLIISFNPTSLKMCFDCRIVLKSNFHLRSLEDAVHKQASLWSKLVPASAIEYIITQL